MKPAELKGRRQAVILIHGIGEQRPMDTLRAFMDGFVGDSSDRVYYSKPDFFSDSFELRRFTTKSDTPHTDFFELYWQHRMRNSKLAHVGSWLWTLLRRWPTTVPSHLFGLWVFTWLATLSVATLLAWSAVLWIFEPAGHSARLPLLFSLLLAMIQGLVLGYVGDAARYLSAAPSNIDCRHAIREAGVLLLLKLHLSRKYSRIAIVGHSLGSVIGYDILTYAWQRLHNVLETVEYSSASDPPAGEGSAESLSNRNEPLQLRVGAGSGRDDQVPFQPRTLNEPWIPTTQSWRPNTLPTLPTRLTDDEIAVVLASQHPTLSKMESLISSWDGATALPEAEELEDFRKRQRKLWIEYRDLGMPWLVTDFVTVGSPLAHAVLLMAKDFKDLKSKQAQRELPTCPPVRDPSAGLSYKAWENGAPRLTLHHAACFAVTRWTNLFFPTRGFLFGDFVAGPVRSLFGGGIDDVTVRTNVWGGWFSHTSYWKAPDRHDAKGSITALRNALDLDCATFDRLPPPPNLEKPAMLPTPQGPEHVHYLDNPHRRHPVGRLSYD